MHIGVRVSLEIQCSLNALIQFAHLQAQLTLDLQAVAQAHVSLEKAAYCPQWASGLKYQPFA